MTRATLPGPAEQRFLITQGEFRISASSRVVLSTLLGSCVSLCLHDGVAGLGGMNHFLLPSPDPADSPAAHSLRYGTVAMAALIEGLLAEGAKRQHLRAKLFGGARMLAGITDHGARNAAFAEAYLRREDIPLVGGSLRGDLGRRVEFWPSTGRTRQLLLCGPVAAPVPRVEVDAVEPSQ